MAKATNQIHTPNSKMTFGDNHGTALRNKMARSVDITGGVKAKIKVKSPPKAMA